MLATGDWAALLAQLELSGAARQLAAHCVWLGSEEGVVRLRLDRRSEPLRTAQVEERVAQAFSKHYGRPTRVVIERDEATEPEPAVDTPARIEARAAEAQLQSARAALESEPAVRGLREQFGAAVVPDTVRPHR
jgi:DNA polymerase-3 subunit gamma/tau